MCDMNDMIDIIANDDHEMLECEECEECFPSYEDFKTQDEFKFCVPNGYYCEACSESLIEKKEEEREREREKEWCINCGMEWSLDGSKNTHLGYLCGVCLESDDEEEE